MPYDIHICRSENWFEADENPITLEEWLAYVERDPEMKLDGYAEATSPSGEVIRIESEGLAVWTAYSKHGLNGNMAWFDYGNGEIRVAHPDSEIFGKMAAMASFFAARVQGDDGELYGSQGEIKPVASS